MAIHIYTQTIHRTIKTTIHTTKTIHTTTQTIHTTTQNNTYNNTNNTYNNTIARIIPIRLRCFKIEQIEFKINYVYLNIVNFVAHCDRVR